MGSYNHYGIFLLSHQEVDKDYTPVDLTFIASSSLQSIIEPIQLQTFLYTRDFADQINNSGENKEDSISATKITLKEKYGQEQETCSINDDQSLESQKCTCDITKPREGVVNVCQCQTSVFQLEDVNAVDSQMTRG